jgi:hypothetical protein
MTNEDSRQARTSLRLRQGGECAVRNVNISSFLRTFIDNAHEFIMELVVAVITAVEQTFLREADTLVLKTYELLCVKKGTCVKL